MAVRLSMLPAGYGDCIWIEHRSRGRVRRVVVDGGTSAAAGRLLARVRALPRQERHIDLLIVTHVDTDHIGGALTLLERPPAGLTIGEVWFNGRRHLPRARGPLHGERLGSVLDELPAAFPWNVAFDGGAVATDAVGAHRVVELPWARATVLSPTPAALAALARVWHEAVDRVARGLPEEGPSPVPRAPARTLEELAGLATPLDRAPANGSSIAVLLEIAGRSVLLAADAHAKVLVPAVQGLAAARGEDRLTVDAVKLPHHGSQGNVTTELVRSLRTRRWLVSTNGRRFGHPDPPAMARVVLDGGPDHSLCFNYRSPQTRRWEHAPLRTRYGYDVVYPATRGGGLAIDL